MKLNKKQKDYWETKYSNVCLSVIVFTQLHLLKIISYDEIRLCIHSPHVINLTLVDLPGIVQVWPINTVLLPGCNNVHPGT